jgi:hypothetical protein
MKSIRFTLSFCAEQEGLINRVAKFNGSGNVAAKERNSNGVAGWFTIFQKIPISRKGNIQNPMAVSEIRDALKIDKGGMSNVCNSEFLRRDLIGFAGVVTHGVLSKEVA